MENIVVDRLMRLLRPLSPELKLEIISKLSENVKIDLHSKKSNKENLLNELFGVWSDLKNDISDEILKLRTNSDRKISFD